MEKRHPNHPGELSTNEDAAERQRSPGELEARAGAIRQLTAVGIPFVVGGAYAYCEYTGIYRDTKDLDIFLRRWDAAKALDVLDRDGWRTERTYEGWLYKAFKGEWFVDLIFSSGNGVAVVDDTWFEHARTGEVFGHNVLLAPSEELIWSKAFVCERERYDGADVAHLIQRAGKQIDWMRLMRRFERYWEVLLSHLLLYRFSYPSERSVVPNWVMSSLMSKAVETMRDGDWPDRICRGNLLSSVNYQVDIREWGYRDGREWDEAERRGGKKNAARPQRENTSRSGR